MKWLLMVTALVFSSVALSSVRVFNEDNAELGHFADMQCGTGVRCAASAGKAYVYMTPVEQSSVSAATTLTLADCGETLVTSQATSFTLPAASGVLGCVYNIVIGVGASADINPANATDKIPLLTNADGDAIRGDGILGNAIKLEAIQAGVSYFWIPYANSVAPTGATWEDIN